MLVDYGDEEDVENTQKDKRDNLNGGHPKPRVDGVELGASESRGVGDDPHRPIGEPSKLNSVNHEIGEVEENGDESDADDEALSVLSRRVLPGKVPVAHRYVALQSEAHR